MKLYTCKRVRTSKPEFDRWALIYEEASPGELEKICEELHHEKCYEILPTEEEQNEAERLLRKEMENERKAEVLVELQKYIESLYAESQAISAYQAIHASLNKLKELLVQYKIPPEEEENESA